MWFYQSTVRYGEIVSFLDKSFFYIDILFVFKRNRIVSKGPIVYFIEEMIHLRLLLLLKNEETLFMS